MTVSSTVDKHRGRSPVKVKFAIIVTSDMLYERSLRGEAVADETGDLMERLVLDSGHQLVLRELSPNNADKIKEALERAVAKEADIVLISGGTGLGPRDVSVDALTPLFDKRIPGFGELFRSLSYSEIGSAAMLSRAEAGVFKGTAVFILPGSPHAARLALIKLILPEAGHLVAEIKGVR
ncbi:MAG: molybdenum cofactor biosynthesis protein [Thermoprotei archaeon]|nr:MAG: molybdenum cofactor biosynthesis protein [Thermoprotei archaeon]